MQPTIFVSFLTKLKDHHQEAICWVILIEKKLTEFLQIELNRSSTKKLDETWFLDVLFSSAFNDGN